MVRTTVKGIHHVGMAVRDLKASLAFYCDTASMQPVEADALSGSWPITPAQTAVIKAPNGYVELMEFGGATDATPSTMKVEGPGVTHLCFQSPAALGLYQRFIDADAKPVSRGDAPIDLNGAGVRYGYACDADNIMFEVEQLDVPQFEGPVWLAHIALVTHDLDATAAFYQNLLGVEPYGFVNKVIGPRFDEVTGLDDVRIRAAWFNTGNMVLEFWQFVNPVTPAPGEPLPFDAIGYNKFALEVGDLQREYQRLMAEGLTFLSEPVTNNGVTEVFARDPDGNLFSLLQPDAGVGVSDLKQIDWLPSPASPDLVRT